MVGFTTIRAPYWDDAPLYIIGGGPSLAGFDFDRIRAKGRLLGVNDSAFHAPCDALFSLDQTWHNKRANEIAAFIGDKWFAAPPNWSDATAKPIRGVNYLVRRRNTGFTDDVRDINGVNSGYGALHLAYHKRAKEIFLLGFDMRDETWKTEGRPGWKAHWFPSYEWHAKECHARFRKIAESFENTVGALTAIGATVVNACPQSAITAFPKCRLDDL